MENRPKFVDHLLRCVNLVIHGKDEEVELILACWLAGGHVLLEDVPGTGKTVLAKTLAKVLGRSFGRIQFTPDLLPSDILGSTIYNKETNQFEFHKGPIFNGIVLADEINRATPRTQSALLEAMAEGQVTIDGKTYNLDEHFFVLATQNPVEHHGTFPLPEAQLDRFFIRLSLGYPNTKSEIQMIKNHLDSVPFEKISKAFENTHVSKMFADSNSVKVSDAIVTYAQNLVEAGRNHKDIELGTSPRAGIALVKIARGLSYCRGEEFVTPSIVHQLVPYVFNHRVLLTTKARMEGRTPQTVIEDILKSVRVPTK